MLQDQRLWVLISLKLSGEATAKELEELEILLNKDAELLKKVEMLQNLWTTPQGSPEEAEQAFAKHFERLNADIPDISVAFHENMEAGHAAAVDKRAGRKYYRFWWGAVAAFVLLFWLIFKSNEEIPPKSINNTVSTKGGYKASINLPDGSKVWLNGASKLTYDGDFQGKTREVYLSGEAFFDVAKDKTRPFIIHTRTINLKVLGTAFNVRSYDYEKETETALVHGSVEVTLRNNPDKKIVLRPGEKLLVKNYLNDTLSNKKVLEPIDEDAPIAVLAKMHYYGNDSSAVETSWTKNQLIFNDERLDKIALNLERWFNVRVIIRDENLKKEKYTATIEEGDKLEEVLEALKVAEGFHYSIKDKEVNIIR